MNLSAIRERVAVELVSKAPTGLYAAAIGWGARRVLPRRLRGPVYKAFAQAVGARLEEAELPLAEYPTFGAFFARRLRPGAREVDTGDEAVVAPCDGVVAAAGVAADGRLIQAKGRDYTVAQLLVDADYARRFEGGAYVTIYLSPRDYHRVHAPVDADLVGYDYVPGTLLPVNPTFSNNVDGLLARNERLVLRLESVAGAVALVMVGAVGVGNMRMEHADLWSGALRRGGAQVSGRFDQPPAVERGDELGAFHLGSTVVLLFEPGVDLDGLVPGEPVRFGKGIGRAPARDGRDRHDLLRLVR